MKLHQFLICSAITGGILLCAGGISGYQYISKLNKELDTTALPHTTFEGIPLDGKISKIFKKLCNRK